MGDLGIHALHLPLRAGWEPANVRAILSDIVTERPDGRGGTVQCDTWDNAVLLCEVEDGGSRIPAARRDEAHRAGRDEHVDGGDRRHRRLDRLHERSTRRRCVGWSTDGRAAGMADGRPRLRLGVSARSRARSSSLGSRTPSSRCGRRSSTSSRTGEGRDAPAVPLCHPGGGGRHTQALHGGARVAARPGRRRSLRTAGLRTADVRAQPLGDARVRIGASRVPVSGERVTDPFPEKTLDANSDNKFARSRRRFGLGKRLNRRFRKQVGGLLIRGSEVRILPGASKCLQIAEIEVSARPSTCHAIRRMRFSYPRSSLRLRSGAFIMVDVRGTTRPGICLSTPTRCGDQDRASWRMPTTVGGTAILDDARAGDGRPVAPLECPRWPTRHRPM